MSDYFGVLGFLAFFGGLVLANIPAAHIRDYLRQMRETNRQLIARGRVLDRHGVPYRERTDAEIEALADPVMRRRQGRTFTRAGAALLVASAVTRLVEGLL